MWLINPVCCERSREAFCIDIFAVSALTYYFLTIETEIFQINFPFIIEHRKGFPGGTSGKESACQCRRHKGYVLNPGFKPWVWKIPWRRKWQPTPVFLPGKFHGQRSLAGYSPWGRKESDTTEAEHTTDTHTNWTHFKFENSGILSKEKIGYTNIKKLCM